MKEDEIIEYFDSSTRPQESVFQNSPPISDLFKDDCAPINGRMIVTTDSMAEDVHFRREWSAPEDLAIKLFQINYSDLLSSGGRAQWALLNLGLPADVEKDFVSRFSGTLLEEMRRVNCRLVGGDTYRCQQFNLGLTLGGVVERYVRRSDGRPENHIYLTGHLGLSLAGYQHLTGKWSLDNDVLNTDPGEPYNEIKSNWTLRELALEKHLRPRARREWAEFLSNHPQVHAMMDLSDGIYSDLPRLARASRVTLEVDLSRIPVFPELRSILTVHEVINSGEEYELLFLAEPHMEFPFPVTRIGRVLPGAPNGSVIYLNESRRVEVVGAGFKHFD